MFLKLFKYEWKANLRLFGMLSGCVFGIGCLATVVLRLLTTYWNQINAQSHPGLLLAPAFIFLVVAYLSIVLYAVAIHYIQLFRFYKSRFTDEGYLMFTLPVKTSHLFLSSALSILIWGVISLLVVFGTLAIVIGLGPAYRNGISPVLKEVYQELGSIFSAVDYTILGVSCVISAISSIMLPLCAIVVGATLAKKHKILAIIGVYYAISTISGIITGALSLIVQIIMLSTGAENLTLIFLSSNICPLLLSIAAYPLSIHFMKNKLNLP